MAMVGAWIIHQKWLYPAWEGVWHSIGMEESESMASSIVNCGGGLLLLAYSVLTLVQYF